MAKKKQVTAVVKLQATGGQATPAPPVGTALGPHGVNIGQFVQQFNEKTRDQMGTTIPVIVTIYSDRTFEFILKSPPAAVLLEAGRSGRQGIGQPQGGEGRRRDPQASDGNRQAEIRRSECPRSGTRRPHHRRNGAKHAGSKSSIEPVLTRQTNERRITRNENQREPSDRTQAMAKHSKRFEFLLKKVENLGPVDVTTAVKTLKGLEPSLPSKIKPCKFDQTVQLAIRLGIDPKQADQLVRGSIVLPHGIGKSKRVLVFAQGNNADIAKARPVPSTSAEKTWPTRSRRDGPISTSPSRRPT